MVPLGKSSCFPREGKTGGGGGQGKGEKEDWDSGDDDDLIV